MHAFYPMTSTIALGLALAACAPKAAEPFATVAAQPPPIAQPVAATSARARVCDVSRTGRYRAGSGGLATSMTVSNEGGWCAKAYNRNRTGPFTGGDIIDAPAHGQARVRHARTNSLLEYRATSGYVGSDRFTATLTPGGGTYIVEVTVQP